MRQPCVKFRVLWGLMLMLLVPPLAASATQPPDLPRPASPTFRADFEHYFTAGNASSLGKLAAHHPDQLRPLMDQLLSDFQSASLSNDANRKKAISALASAVAKEAKRVNGDRFPMRQVKRYLTWTPEELSRKSDADIEFQKAGTAYDEGRYGDAAAPARSAIDSYAALGDEAGEGDALHVLGQAERKLTNYTSALDWHERALALARKSGDSFREGRGLIDLADVYERQKDWQRAVDLYRRAASGFKMPACWRETSRALRQLGDVYTGGKDFVRAYEAYSRALSYAEAAQDAALMAEANDYLGYCHRQLGDFERALQYHGAAFEISARLTDQTAASKARARALNHLGICYLETAERAVSDKDEARGGELFSLAAKQEEDALKLAAEARDMWRQGYILRALSLIHLRRGMILNPNEAAAEYREALDRADQALALASSMKEQEWEGLALHQRGLAQLRLGQEAEGLATFQRALDLWERIGDLLSAGYANRFIARQFHEPHQRFAEAIASYERAQGAFRKIGDSESEACVMTDMAHAHGALGHKEEAVRLYDGAMAKLENVRSKAGLPEFRKALMGKVYDRYEEATLFMLENGLNDRAFKLAESMKARLFLDQLAEARVDPAKGIDPQLRKKRDRIEKDLSFIASGIIDELRKPSPAEAEIHRLKERQEKLEAELDRLRKQIRLNNPLYSSVQYPEPITVSELQTKVLRDDEALIEYFLSKKGVFCFVVTREDFQVARIAVDEAAVQNHVETLLENVIQGPRRGEGFDRPAAAEIYDLLLRPFEWAMRGRTLFIVPDGVLARLPFETLVVKDGDDWRYFLENQTVKYLQSASVLAVVRALTKHNGGNDSFVGFGDPVFDYESFKSGKPEKGAGKDPTGRSAALRFAQSRGQLGRLESSGEEVRAIEHLFSAKTPEHKALLRAEATEQKAKSKEMERFDYIHFSTHGLLAPGFQAIALSQIPGDREDGFLTIGELMNMKYNAGLVVLSACETGLGRAERGEGVTGLTRAVMYAGSPAAVVSLWSVDDMGTKELMVRFYDNMIRKGLAKAEALRSAKKDMLRIKYRHPFFWSAFVMYGE
ncbi:MAG: CHAT domain-containing tetratricopeptide repeat protein [Syntrophobacter sp.]